MMNIKFWGFRASCLLGFAFATGVVLADAPLRPGDQIQMKLGGVPTTEIAAVSGVYTIDGDGSVNLPQIGHVKIAGLTPGAAESTIEDAYKTKEIYTNPNIVITMQSRFVNVGGEVKAPQRVPYTPDLTILSSINAAGGFSSFADGRKVRLLRDNRVMIIDVLKIRANPSLDVQLQPGDKVDAPSIFEGAKKDGLQHAQQDADVVSSQRTATESDLRAEKTNSYQAQQNADTTSIQQDELKTELKQTKDKLQKALQEAEAATSARNAVDTELNRTRNALQQALHDADAASKQRATLETELKQTREKLEEALNRANLESEERTALEARLTRAPGNVQVTDLSISKSQRMASISNSSGDSGDQPGSGRTLPLDAGQNEGRAVAPQQTVQPGQPVNQ
jgi:protein involved in polysaccharide export with SLBB domain